MGTCSAKNNIPILPDSPGPASGEDTDRILSISSIDLASRRHLTGNHLQDENETVTEDVHELSLRSGITLQTTLLGQNVPREERGMNGHDMDHRHYHYDHHVDHASVASDDVTQSEAMGGENQIRNYGEVGDTNNHHFELSDDDVDHSSRRAPSFLAEYNRFVADFCSNIARSEELLDEVVSHKPTNAQEIAEVVNRGNNFLKASKQLPHESLFFIVEIAHSRRVMGTKGKLYRWYTFAYPPDFPISEKRHTIVPALILHRDGKLEYVSKFQFHPNKHWLYDLEAAARVVKESEL